MNQLKAGIAKKDISPEKALPGRLGLNHLIHPHHDISSKALALSNGDEKHVIISCEIVGLTGSENRKIREAVTAETGIPGENIVIVCTHTHASPWVWDLQHEQAEMQGFNVLDKQWMDKVIENASSAAVEAVENLKSAQLRLGKAGVEKVASNRVDPVTRWSICADDEIRNAPDGLIDPETRVISVHHNEKPEAVFANYACHPSAYGGGRTKKVSPDFPYFAEKDLREKLGEDFFAAYWQGCAGNINSGKYVKEGSEEEVAVLGLRFKEAVEKALEKPVSTTEEGYEFKYKKFKLPVGDFVKSPEEAQKLFVEMSKRLKRQDSISEQEVFDWRALLKKLDVSLVSDGKSMEIEFQLFRFKDFDLFFVPGEWYVQLYFNLKRQSDERELILTTMNNFDLLYIPDRESMVNKDWYGVRTGMRSLGDESAVALYEEAEQFLGS